MHLRVLATIFLLTLLLCPSIFKVHSSNAEALRQHSRAFARLSSGKGRWRDQGREGWLRKKRKKVGSRATSRQVTVAELWQAVTCCCRPPYGALKPCPLPGPCSHLVWEMLALQSCQLLLFVRSVWPLFRSCVRSIACISCISCIIMLYI